MFTLIDEDESTIRMEIELPIGKTNDEILAIAHQEVPYFSKQMFQKDIKLKGDFPNFIILFLAHYITHTVSSVSILVDDEYIKCIEHQKWI